MDKTEQVLVELDEVLQGELGKRSWPSREESTGAKVVGMEAAEAAGRDLRRYYRLVADYTPENRFDEHQIDVIACAIHRRGLRSVEPEVLKVLPIEVEKEAREGRGQHLDMSPEDAIRTAERITDLEPLERVALIDAVERLWGLLGQGVAMSTGRYAEWG